MSERRGLRPDDLPLFWKLLLPFLILMLILGTLGAFFIVRDLAARAQASLDVELGGRSIEVRSALRDRELYLVESASFATNIRGMAGALRRRQRPAVDALLRSVLALKRDLDILAAVDLHGRAVVEYDHGAAGPPGGGTDWSGQDAVERALRSVDGAKIAGFVQVGTERVLAIVAPVCTTATGCHPVGAALTGFRTSSLLAAVAADVRSLGGVGLYGADGARLGGVGTIPGRALIPDGGGDLIRSSDARTSTVFADWDVQGARAGIVAVALPRGPAFAGVRRTGSRLVVTLLVTMAGIVGVGVLLSRSLLRRVRLLLVTNRALGEGDLSARTPVAGRDELGELARGVNVMAEKLQGSYETLESRVAERTEEIERLLRERSEFFAGLSHELRTPLAVILSQADLILDPTFALTIDWARQAGRTLRASGQHLISVVNEILELAEAEAGGIDLHVEDVRLPEVIRELRPTLKGLARGGDLRLRMDVPRTLPPVRADRTRLREVILNLVDNAVKYTPSGGAVRLTAAAENGRVIVRVADTGVGIPEEARERIFEPFFRVPGTRPQRGQPSSGLGLALARRIVEAQGGTIDFTSVPNGGTTFTFSLERSPSR